MSGVVVVTGTDTGIGKTVAAATLTLALDAHYWKPVQSGTEDGTDSETVAALTGLPPERILPEAYRLLLPASPHLSARAEGIDIDPGRLALPSEPRPLVVEGAGGLMVPLALDPPLLLIDQIAAWGAPVLLCARTALGTINHSLLSVEALQRRGVAIAGLLFIGDPYPENEAVIPALSGLPSLGRIPMMTPISPEALREAGSALNLAPVWEALA